MTDVLSVVTSLCALVLGVTLYAITRDQDRELAMLALLAFELLFATWLIVKGVAAPEGKQLA